MNVAQYKCSLAIDAGQSPLERSMAIAAIEDFPAGVTYPYDVVIWSNVQLFTEAHAAALPNLKLLINWGTDDNNLDMALLASRNVTVKKVDYYATETLAEYIVSLLLMYERKHVQLLAGDKLVGRELYRKKVGIIGLGKIGFLTATMLRDAYKCDVSYYSRSDKQLPQFMFMELRELFARCDYIIITVKSANFSIDISQYICSPELIIVNISRDSVLPLESVLPEITRGAVRGFIGDLDPIATPQALPDSVLLFPHRGYLTRESIALKQLILRFYLRTAVTEPDRSYLYLVRHGETEGDRQSLLQGRTDLLLTSAGTAHAAALAKQLAGRGIQYVYTSPLGRAHQTAAIIAQALGARVVLVPAYAEIDMGIFEGRPQQAIRQLFDDFYAQLDARAHCALYATYPNGESYYDVYLRALGPSLEMLAQSPPFVVVGHKYVNRVLRGIATETPLKQAIRLPQRPDEIIRIDRATGDATALPLS